MAESFTTLGSEDLQWSDTNHTTSDDITDDELWSDDNIVVSDNTPWDDNDATTHSTTTAPPVVNTSSIQDTYAPTSNDPLLQSEVLTSLNNDITANEMLGVTESANEIAADNLSPDRENNNNVIPIEAPSILTCDATLATTQDGSPNVLTIDNYSQPIVLLCKEDSSEDVETCFDELVDLPSSPEPEAMAENDITFYSNPSPALPPSNMIDIKSYPSGASIMEDQCLVDQLSHINSTEVDDDCVDEDFDWN